MFPDYGLPSHLATLADARLRRGGLHHSSSLGLTILQAVGSASVQRMTSLAEGVIKNRTICRSIKRQFRKLGEVVSGPTAIDVLVLIPPPRPLDGFARASQVDSERSASKFKALGTSVHGNPAIRCITR